MNVIYIGSIYPAGLQEKLLKKGSVIGFAGHTFQAALISGLDECYPDMKVISSALTSPFPKIKELNCRQFNFSHKGEEVKSDKYVGGLNLPLIKLFSKYLRVKKALRNSLKNNDDNVVIVYGTHSPFLLAVHRLRKRISKAIVVVPDLPEFMSGNSGTILIFLKKLDKKLINRCLSSFDGFVLLSPYMREKLPVNEKPWLQFEGIYQINKVQEETVEKETLRTIMYTGNIYRRRGVDLLLEAFRQIDKPNYRLWIRGNGELKQTILDLAREDPRIVYFEPVEREELLRMERKATVMVNPTPASLEFTKYFFPSKTMEYMASGTPTLMFRLACLPKEYEPYVFFSDESVEALRDKLIEICEMPQEALDRFGKAASDFIISNKNAQVQARRVHDFINTL